MSRLPAIQTEGADRKARELLEAVQAKLKITPNMTRVMANSPAVLEGYLGLLLRARQQHGPIAQELKLDLLAFVGGHQQNPAILGDGRHFAIPGELRQTGRKQNGRRTQSRRTAGDRRHAVAGDGCAIPVHAAKAPAIRREELAGQAKCDRTGIDGYGRLGRKPGNEMAFTR